jgi:prepilin-type N-terminal cleavage/methylation domain-containing protein
MNFFKKLWRPAINLMKRKNFNAGFTLIEMLAATFLIGFVTLGIYKIFTPATKFFRHIQVRNQTSNDVQRCLETIKGLLTKADPKTVMVTTPGGTPPNSRLEFMDMKRNRFRVYWSPDFNGSVIAEESPPITFPITFPDPILKKTHIARNVSGFSITLDSQDPAVLNVALRIDAPYSPHEGIAGGYHSVFIPSQQMRLNTNP